MLTFLFLVFNYSSALLISVLFPCFISYRLDIKLLISLSVTSEIHSWINSEGLKYECVI